MSKRKEEFVELTVRIPRSIMDYFRAYWKFVGFDSETPEEYLVNHANKNLPSFIADTSMLPEDVEAIIETYGLEPYRKLMGFPSKKVKPN